MPDSTTLQPSQRAGLSASLEDIEILRWAQPGTLTAATLGAKTITKRGQLKPLHIRIGVTGTVTNTVFELRRIRAGVTVVLATVTILQSETDPHVAPRAAFASLADSQVEPGDVLEVVLTTVPTGGSNLEVVAENATRYLVS